MTLPSPAAPERPEADLALFDLRLMIDQAAERFGRAARSKGLALEVKTAPTVPGRAIGDAERLREVLFGLVDNAVKFTERGEVVASLTAEQTPGGRALLHAEVSDTGVGVPPETVALFDERPRRDGGDGAVTLAPAATGGLATARRQVELMDGQVGCSSALGMGTTVWFTVPLDLPAD